MFQGNSENRAIFWDTVSPAAWSCLQIFTLFFLLNLTCLLGAYWFLRKNLIWNISWTLTLKGVRGKTHP